MEQKEIDYSKLLKEADEVILEKNIGSELVNILMKGSLIEPMSQLDDKEESIELFDSFLKSLTSQLPDITYRMLNVAVVERAEYIRKCIKILKSRCEISSEECIETHLNTTDLIFKLKYNYISFGSGGDKKDKLFTQVIDAADFVDIMLKEDDRNYWIEMWLTVRDIIINQ